MLLNWQPFSNSYFHFPITMECAKTGHMLHFAWWLCGELIISDWIKWATVNTCYLMCVSLVQCYLYNVTCTMSLVQFHLNSVTCTVSLDSVTCTMSLLQCHLYSVIGECHLNSFTCTVSLGQPHIYFVAEMNTLAVGRTVARFWLAVVIEYLEKLQCLCYNTVV